MSLPQPFSVPFQQAQVFANNRQTLTAQSCVRKLPNIGCQDDSTCQTWANQNCSESDKLGGHTFCDKKQNVCAFIGNGRDPVILGGV
jgi:hypothetical protein